MTLLWDMEKFFDSINIKKLFDLAEGLNFPMKQLLLSITVHQAPRLLKLGSALSEPIVRLGRSILAGCKRSTQMAAVYTLNMVKQLSDAHRNSKLYIHVDDISNLIKANSEAGLIREAIKYAKDFARHARGLLLTISDKTTAVPDSNATRKFASMAQRLNIPMKVAKEGVDIGVDTSSASRRTTKKQKARITQTRHRATRVALLARKTTRVRRLAMTGVKPAQSFGHTAAGMAPTTINGCKTNILEATGMMGTGACATSVIRWAFRKGRYANISADPRVCIPYDQTKAWMAIHSRMSTPSKLQVEITWPKRWAKLKKAKSRWQCVKGPMDATIATLIDAGWQPVHPTTWIIPGGQSMIDFDETPGISHYRVLHHFREGLETKLWKHASETHGGGGLEDGVPHFGPASRAHNDFVKQGKHKEARALEVIVTGRSWCGERKLEAGIIEAGEAMCTRCGENILETDYHKYYECKANDDIDEETIRCSSHLHKDFRRNTTHACRWYRGIMPGSCVGQPVGWTDELKCDAIIMGNLEGILNRTGKAGTDGGGGPEKDQRNRTVTAGAAVFDPDTKQVAFLFARVPGMPTVPRAELWALYQLMLRMRNDIEYTVYIDASYVLNGLHGRTKHYSQGFTS